MTVRAIAFVFASIALLPLSAAAAEVKIERSKGTYEYKYKTEDCDFKYAQRLSDGKVEAKAKGDCPPPGAMPGFNPPRRGMQQAEDDTPTRAERLRDAVADRRDRRRREATRDCQKEVARDARRYGAANKRTARNVRTDLADCRK